MASRADNPTTADRAALTLRELLATQPRTRRGSLAPGERFPTGMRPGRRRAQGVDLDSIGPYVLGDDLRFMDWRATARTGRAQMKRFVAESHLARMLVVDFRAPMFFATAEHPMAKTAALVAGRLAWEAFSLHEPLGLVVVPEAQLIEPRRGRTQVLRVLETLVESYARCAAARDAGAEDAFAEALERAAQTVHRGDEVNLLSDFGGQLGALDDVARELAAIRNLHAIVIEDAIFTRAVPPGRYPMQSHRDGTRTTAVVTAEMARRHGEMAAEVRGDVRRALVSAGVRVTEVTGGEFLSEGGR